MSVSLFIAQEVGRTLVDSGDWIPTVTIDVSESPEVADLARVHAIEGIGDVATSAIRHDDTVLLGVQLTKPVQATFAVVFSYDLHKDFLGEVADAGALIFATTDTESARDDGPIWLSVDINGDALRHSCL
jgi:hypothetical protein